MSGNSCLGEALSMGEMAGDQSPGASAGRRLGRKKIRPDHKAATPRFPSFPSSGGKRGGGERIPNGLTL